MRILDLLNRIVWDKSLNKSDFYVEYVDRPLGYSKASLGNAEVGGFLVIDGKMIPVHRVRRIFWKDIVIFDRSWVININEKLKDYPSHKWRFDVVNSTILGCKGSYPSLPRPSFPVVICGEVLNCSMLLAYKKAGTPLIPVYICDDIVLNQ